MIQISNKVFYIGTNDRKKHLFENNWPLPNGVAYNSYIIADEHPALVDTRSSTARIPTTSPISTRPSADASWSIWWSITWSQTIPA